MNTCTTERRGYAADGAPAMRNDRHQPSIPMMDGTLIRLQQLEHTVAISAYCRKHGRSSKFYIDKARLADWLNSSSSYSFLDRDGSNFMQSFNAGEEIRIDMSWLSTMCSGRMEGYAQSFELPRALLAEVLECDGERSCLWTDSDRPRKLDFSGAATAMRYMTENKLRRRAFCKAITKAFSWRGTKRIVFHSDFPSGSFRFFEYLDGDGPGMNGGFILHSSTMATPAGEKERLYYSVHT